MPQQVWKCKICGHVTDVKSVAESCEKSHVSLIGCKKIIETYNDMEQFPRELSFNIETVPEVIKTIKFVRTDITRIQ